MAVESDSDLNLSTMVASEIEVIKDRPHASETPWLGRSILLLALVLWTVFAVRVDRGPIGNGIDDGLYFVGAESLVDGGGYRLPSRPGDPIAGKYPLGTSLICSAAITLVRATTPQHRYAVARGLLIASGWIFAFAFSRVVKKMGLSALAATFIPLAILFHPETMMFSVMLTSELPFLAIASILLLRYTRDNQHICNRTRGQYFIDGLLLGSAVVVRGNGISLVAGIALSIVICNFGLSRAKKSTLNNYLAACFLILGFMLVILPIEIYQHTLSGPRDTGSYFGEISAGYTVLGVGHIVETNVGNAIRTFSDLLVPQINASSLGSRLINTPLKSMAAAIPAVVLIAAGIIKCWQRRSLNYLTHWTHALLTLLIFFFWPWPLGLRFILPMLPLLLILMGVGVSAIIGWIGWRPPTTVEAWPAMIGFATSLVAVAGIVNRARHDQWTWGGVDVGQDQVFQFAREHTEPNAVLVSMIPETIYTYCHRTAVPIIEDKDVLVGQFGKWGPLDQWIAKCGDRPIYFVGEAPDTIPDGEAIQIKALLLSAGTGHHIDPIFYSSDKLSWVARLER